jgi:hypothetical protein
MGKEPVGHSCNDRDEKNLTQCGEETWRDKPIFIKSAQSGKWAMDQDCLYQHRADLIRAFFG